MKSVIKIIAVLTIIATYSCNEDDVDFRPGAADLVFPLKDVECQEGRVVSETESIVPFEWNSGNLATKYTVSVTNLVTDSTETFNADDTRLDIKILRGTPYSWKVISRSDATSQTSQSDVWNLYNAGPGIENYSPFPARLVLPKMGSAVNTPTVTLAWEGIDLDNDIQEFEIFMDTATPPAKSVRKVEAKTTSIDEITEPDTVYYWQVITTDQHGNTTKSPVFEFKRTNL